MSAVLSTPGYRRAMTGVWIAVIAMLILHQDIWFWDDATMVFGFMPIGLFYHACFSLAAATLWACASVFAWPSHMEAEAADEEPDTVVAEKAHS